ncbi:hypothetical protein [Geodermatophilus sp. SYSU D01119]
MATVLPAGTTAPPTTATVTRPPVRAGGPSAATLVGVEVRKSLSTRSGRSLAAAAALLAPAATVLVASASDEDLGSVTGPIGVMGMLTGLVLVALGVLSSAGEWSHRTVQTTYLLVPRRGRVLGAKAAAVGLLGAALAAVSAALVAGALALLADGVSWDGAGRALGVVAAAGAVFALVGTGIGAALANTPAALTSFYLVVLGVLPLVRTFKPEVGSRLDPAEAVLALAQEQAQTQSLLVLAGWLVASLAAGAVVTRRRAVA